MGRPTSDDVCSNCGELGSHERCGDCSACEHYCQCPSDGAPLWPEGRGWTRTSCHATPDWWETLEELPAYPRGARSWPGVRFTPAGLRWLQAAERDKMLAGAFLRGGRAE